MYNNKNIAYIGRWLDKGSYMSSGWGGAYFKTNFSGNSVKLDLAGSADIYVSIDGGEDTLYNVVGAGVVNITPSGLESGIHTLRVASKYTTDSIKLRNIILNDGEELSKPEISDTLIEFMGDSNTAGYLLPNNQLDNYSWLTGEALGEHVHIAYTGMALSDGIFNTNISRDVGMSVMFFKPSPSDERDDPDWDFTKYTPDIVCMNLGGNDEYENVVPGGVKKFKETLPVFLAKLRSTYPNSHIVVLIPTTTTPDKELYTAISELVDGMGDSKMHWYAAYPWIADDLSGNRESDNVHISVKGNKIVAEQLTQIFKDLLGK